MAPIDWISRPIVAEGIDENGNHYSISRMEALDGAEYSVFVNESQDKLGAFQSLQESIQAAEAHSKENRIIHHR